jgi:hypothetical protein
MKRIILAVVAVSALAIPAFAEEVGVGVGPVGVTVGSGPDRVVRDKEVVREREPRDKVIVKEHRDHDPVVEKKTVIHDHD